MNETVTAKTHWVWTDKAEKLNPARSRAGEKIWSGKEYNAPKYMLDDGLIIDSTEYVKEGQTDLFDYL